MKKRISLTIDENLLKWIDDKREYVPRSTYINHIFSVFRKIKNGDEVLHEFDTIFQK